MIALAAAVWVPVASLLARALIVTASLPHADAVLVLSGSAVIHERVREAATVVISGRAPLVLLTDDGGKAPWSRSRQTNPLDIDQAVDDLQSLGVPPERIVKLPGIVRSTYEEALRTRAYSAGHELKSLVLATSAYHTRRALWTFRQVLGDDVQVGLAAAPPGLQTPDPARWWLSSRGWNTVGAEYPKLAYYLIAHRSVPARERERR